MILTACAHRCLLVLWGKGLEEEVYEDICYQQTRWNCFQWATDGSLLLVITPLTLSRGMYYGWTRLILALLAITMSAKLALIGCYSRSIAPIAFQTFFTFWVALTVMWLVCWRRERQLLRIQSSNTTALIKQQAVLGRVSSSHVACSGCVGMDGSRSGWKTWLCLALCGTLSVTFCNFLLMLFKLWLDEPSTFERFADGSGSGANSYNRHKALPLDPDTGDDAVFSREGDLRLVELLMGGPGLALSAKLGKRKPKRCLLHFERENGLLDIMTHHAFGCNGVNTHAFVRGAVDNGKVFVAALLLTNFSVVQAKYAARYCAPSEHLLAALLICPPGVPQILGCTKARQFREL